MTEQAIPSGVETIVSLCCEPWSAVGADSLSDNGQDGYIAGSAAGLYSVCATVPYGCTDFHQGVTQLTVPDDGTDMNGVGETTLPWTLQPLAGPSFSGALLGGDPSVMFCRFDGIAKHTVSLLLTGGTPGTGCKVWVRKNTVGVLQGVGIGVFDAAGIATVDFVATDPNAAQLDELQIVGQSTGGAAPAFVDAVSSFWLAERVIGPTVSGTMTVWDSTGTYLYDADSDQSIGYTGSLKFASTVMLPDHGQIRLQVLHDFGQSDLEVESEMHIDAVYVSVGVPIQECPEVPNGGGGGG